MLSKIYLLHAKAQSGKNSCAEAMRTIYSDMGKETIIIAFADYVRFTLEKYYGINDFKSEEGRTAIQHYATDKIRNEYDKKFWAKIVANYLDAVKNDFDVAVIPDWRFKNELKQLNKHFGNSIVIPVLITRPNIEQIDHMNNDQRHHISETELDGYNNFKYKITNQEGQFGETYQQLLNMIRTEIKI